ncbi:hypothetical protein DFO54_107116 [Erwinia sp. AG740]|nr:hypothetical protein DFO54_107116 [Erwinia sp. AG740]
MVRFTMTNQTGNTILHRLINFRFWYSMLLSSPTIQMPQLLALVMFKQ